MYFEKVKKGDKVFGIIFGKGKVIKVKSREFVVKFDIDKEVTYNFEGKPYWNNFDFQTVFYADLFNTNDYDFSSSTKVPSPKKIAKWRFDGKCEIKVPSGLWINSKQCPWDFIEEVLERRLFNKVRKAK